MADTRPRIARFIAPTAPRGAAPPPAPAFRPMAPVPEDDADVVDVEYIVENKPKPSIVRDFMRVQARALTEQLAGEDDYL